jgi:NADH-quinone oxidoreductase subunit L
MENYFSFVSMVVFTPLLGMIINLFAGKSVGERGVAIIGVGASSLAFFFSFLLWIALVDTGFEGAVVNPPLINDWIKIPSEGIDIPWQFRVDTLSVTMMLTVTFVGTMIHLYAVGYMHGDERFPRFFVYLNLFLFFMLILVTGNNLLMMFVGWEGVGLCSFLLIGFWFDKPQKHPTEGTVGWANSNAARKAFIANRVGDFGLIMGVFLTFWTFGTLDFYKAEEDYHQVYEEIHHAQEAEEVSPFEVEGLEEHGEGTHHGAAMIETFELHNSAYGIFTQAELQFAQNPNRKVGLGPLSLEFDLMITLITLFFVLGVTGKSAQIPLFVWLPDAMAGPTPVSALIHAATMVTAGIYLMVRSNSFFYHSDFTEFVVTSIGITTALVAGFIAFGQWDIKKVLAYSTVSQLGFMVAAVGLGAYVAAMFHLVTHAFFKALLFLGSGSIIHGVEHGHHHVHGHGHGHGDGHDDHHKEDHHGHDSHSHDAHHDEDPFDPQDLRNMGGLRHRMPITYWTYLIGALGLAGVFPLAGFWSKDEILVDALNVGFEEGQLKGYLALAVLFISAGFTAFYIWRQVSLIFYGEPRTEAAANAPESARTMLIPLIVLAIGTLLIGMMNIPKGFPLLDLIFGKHEFKDWVAGTVIHVHAASFNLILAVVATILAVGAIYLARSVYTDNVLNRITDKDPLEEDAQIAPAFALAKAKLYWDEIYFALLIYPYQRAAKFIGDVLDWKLLHDFFHDKVLYQGFQGSAELMSKPIDRQIIDEGFMSVGKGIGRLGSLMRHIQTGYVRTYALSLFLGVLLVIVIILFPLLRDMLGL